MITQLLAHLEKFDNETLLRKFYNWHETATDFSIRLDELNEDDYTDLQAKIQWSVAKVMIDRVNKIALKTIQETP